MDRIIVSPCVEISPTQVLDTDAYDGYIQLPYWCGRCEQYHVTINPVDELECKSCHFVMFCYTCVVCGWLYHLCRECSDVNESEVCDTCQRDKQIDTICQ